MTVRFLCAMFAATLGVSVLAPASAQAQQSAADDTLEEIVVTGSRLARPGSAAPIPVTSVSAEDIAISGATLISDYIGDLPQFGINNGRMTEVSGQATNAPLATAGSERLNLRDLGAERTLVVVDGRRHVGSVAGATVVDVGSIPTALIDRVEMSTGGASVAYGADAIAGVVNFIMKKDFEGIQLDTRYGDSHQGGGDSKYLALTVGGNFADDRGNAVVSASFNELGGIEGFQRDFVRDRWGFIGNPADTGPNDGIPSLILSDNVRLTSIINERGILYGLLTDSALIFDEGGLRPAIPGEGTSASGFVAGGDGMDLVKNTNVATPMERTSVLGRVNYSLTDNVDLFLEGKYYAVDAEVVSPPMLDAVVYTENSQLFLIDRANPFLSQNDPLLDQFYASNAGLVTMSRAHYEDLGRREGHVNRDLYRIVTGIEGETGFRDWGFELFAQFGDTSEQYIEINNRDPRRFRLATDAVVDVNGVTGVPPGSPACRATVQALEGAGTDDPDILDCHPVNLFGLGLASQESLDYFMIDLLTTRSLEQIVVGGSLQGSLFEMPAGPVSFAAGFEYREEKSETRPDNAQVQGRTFAGQFLPVEGSYDVIEAFFEGRLPLLQDQPFAHALAIEGGFRASDYNVTGSASSWRTGVEWAPVSDLRFRGMYAEAVRAPGIEELFAPRAPSIAVPPDPCTMDNVGLGPDPARRLANCTAELAPFGLDPQTWDPDPTLRSNFIGILGGNQDLEEETAKTLTLGFVYTPNFFDDRLALTVDYYDVEIDGVIVSPGWSEVVNNCYDRFDTIDNLFCDLVTRNETPGVLFAQLDSIDLKPQNLNTLSTSGIDFEVNYGFEMQRWLPGGFNVRLLANYLDSYKILALASATEPDEFAGSTRRPEWRGQLQLMYYTEPLSLSYRLRYVHDVRLAGVPAANPIETQDPLTVGAETISDVHLAYDFGAAGGEDDRYQLELYLGIDNLFDTTPPPGIRTGRSSASSTYYDPMGRFYYGGVKVNF